MASFLLCRKPLDASKAQLQLLAAVTTAIFAGFLAMPGDKLLQLPESSLAIWFFYRVSKLLDGIFPPLQETLTCLKSSAAALGHSCGARFCQVPGHAFRLSRSSFQNLPFAGQVSCQMVFLSRFDSGG